MKTIPIVLYSVVYSRTKGRGGGLGGAGGLGRNMFEYRLTPAAYTCIQCKHDTII